MIATVMGDTWRAVETQAYDVLVGRLALMGDQS
jgi:hypothetical protein